MDHSPQNRCLLVLMLVAGLAGCALQPAPDARALREQQLPALQASSTWSASATAGQVAGNWLADFADPQLHALVAEAVANNRDLKLAAVRVEQARAMVSVNGGTLYPAVGVAGVVGKSDTEVLSLSASWEIDLWGRVRAQARSAENALAASDADRQWAEQLIAAATARAWLALVQYQQLELRQQALVASQESLLTITTQRVHTGISAESELLEVSSALQQQRDKLGQLQLARVQAAQALEVLLGRYPAGELTASAALPELPAAPPAGLPANLLERRPDLVAAERRVAAAFDMQQSAEAARLPKLSISAAITDISSDVFLLNQANNPIKGISASFLAPLFTGGQLQGQADYYSAVQQEAALAYGSKALDALQEVESGLRAEESMKRRAGYLQTQLADQRQLLAREQVRVKVGSRDPRSVLQREQSVLAAEMGLIQLQTAQLNQRISLLLSLGGRWDSSPAV
ncbi:efflux transporter outer membrane subunit [Chitinilyticum piscinae]|uniref:Efflux transporter outer membrane subunit n=1 Tax=Chitinilyticum piscinae TaxID=2866724 RepID=A0A8J7K936_9NEIS|nr:efflux transporter outer membrane subunit [Chitinilyticum piscinae]MBE9610603.1 efflux transporter outer membrane subunit [Chitinilyticum piscinae]